MANNNDIDMGEIRQVSSDGKFIRYDLTRTGFKLNPKSICSVLARDVFQFSARKWISIIDNEITFFPDSQITIIWPIKKGMKTNSLEERFLGYLRKDNVLPTFQKQIEAIPSSGPSGVAFMVGGYAGAVIDELTNTSNAKAAFISKIMSLIKKNISFEYSS